jgi:hypothetical protein
VYYGLSAASLDTVIELANPGLTSYTVEDLSAGTWYFAVTAYSAHDAESALSEVQSKRIE